MEGRRGQEGNRGWGRGRNWAVPLPLALLKVTAKQTLGQAFSSPSFRSSFPTPGVFCHSRPVHRGAPEKQRG